MDAIVYPSSRLLNYMNRYSYGIGAKRTIVIPHMPVWWRNQQWSPRRGRKLKIRYAGTITKWRPLDGFYDALDLLMGMQEVDCGDLSIEIMGRLYGTDGSELEIPNKYSDIISIVSSRTIDEVYTWLSKADAMLLLENDFRNGIFMPSKLADMIQIGGVIVAVSPQEGTVSDLAEYYERDNKTMLIASPGNSIELAQNICRLYIGWRNDELVQYTVPNTIRERFNARAILRTHENMQAFGC